MSRYCVDLSTLNAVINHLCSPGFIQANFPPVIVEPQSKKQYKTRPKVEQKKDIYMQPNHRPGRLKALNIEQSCNAGIVMDAADPLTEQLCDT